jgi:hypothetical protein
LTARRVATSSALMSGDDRTPAGAAASRLFLRSSTYRAPPALRALHLSPFGASASKVAARVVPASMVIPAWMSHSSYRNACRGSSFAIRSATPAPGTHAPRAEGSELGAGEESARGGAGVGRGGVSRPASSHARCTTPVSGWAQSRLTDVQSHEPLANPPSGFHLGEG